MTDETKNTNVPHNVDDLLIKSQSNETSIDENNSNDILNEPSAHLQDATQVTDDQASVTETTSESDKNESKEPKEPKEPIDSAIDEYGNPKVEPKSEPEKRYTDEDVQRMIRERLARGKHIENETPPSSSSDNQENNENWEVQLEQFIDKTLSKREKALMEERWKEQELTRQAQFEAKFTEGMNKYTDFHQVVAGKPITDSMMLATRSLDNPAAFIYGAAKTQPQELERISKIVDPYVQASEIGRLHEKMVKERNRISKAPAPIDSPKGDMPIKQVNSTSIEQRIHEYAKSKRK